jgi:hypothetical protein
MLVGSGAVKDDLPVLRETRELGLELLKGQSPLELQAAAFGLVWVSTDQEGLAGFNPGIDLLRGDTYRSCHDASPFGNKIYEIASTTEGKM